MTHINFPDGFDDDQSLYIAVNNLRTRLTASITAGVDTIPVVTTAGFPATGFVSILTGEDITKTEAITYSGISSTAFLNAGRGADGTTAFEHISNDSVDLTIVADHHNSLKDAIFELEKYVGVSGAENFLRIDDDGDVSIPGIITVSGGADFAFVTVTGTLSVCSDGDFKEDMNVSGTLFVGELPVSNTPPSTFQFEDTIFNTGTDNTYQETGVSIVPDSGLNLVLWRENASAGSEGTSAADLKVTYSSSALAEVGPLFSIQGGHWNAGELMGFKVVDADGTSSVKLHARSTGGSRSLDVGAQQLISVPLAQMGLVSGTDFWYDNGIEGDTNIPTTLNGTPSGMTTVTSMPVNVTEAGRYLVMMSHDTKMQTVAAVGRWAAYLFVNETNVSNHMAKEATGVAEYQNAPWAQTVNLVAGLNTIEIRAGKWTGTGPLNMRRGRLCAIKGSSFDQLQGTRSFTDVDNNTDTFTEITALSQTYTPNQREQVLVIGVTNSISDDLTGTKAVATYKLRDDTDGIDYAIDWGTPAGDLNNSVPAFGFALKENTIETTDWKMLIREPNLSTNTGSMNHGAMVVWSLSTSPITSTQFTRLSGSKILSPDICADTITVINSGTLTLDGGDLVAPTGTFSESLTISGAPVATGTGATTLQDAYDGGDGTIASTSAKPVQTGDLTVTGTILTRADATTPSPISIGPSDDLDTGISFDGSSIRFTSNASQKFVITNNLVRLGAPLEVQAGTALLPGLTYISDTDTGFFNKSADVIGISAGGTETLTVSGVNDATDGVGIEGNLTVTGTVGADVGEFSTRLDAPAGLFPTPGLTFAGRTDTGFEMQTVGGSDHPIRVIADGNLVFTMSKNAITFGKACRWRNNGTAAIPQVSYQPDSDTGLFQLVNGDNTFAFTTGGVRAGYFDSNQNFHADADVLITGTVTAVTGTFTDSLTVSGVPVDITGGGGGGGGGTITDINTTATGPSVTITGVGNIQTITEGNVITITGAAPSEGFRGAVVVTSTGISVPTGATALTIPWDTERYDTDGFHTGDFPTKLTIPAGINKVQVSYTLRWKDEFSDVTAGVAIWIAHLDSSDVQQAIYSLTAGIQLDTTAQELLGQFAQTPTIDVVEGDYFLAKARHDQGGTLTIATANYVNYFALEVKDPVATTQNDIVAISGTFSESLTVSGVPVDITGGGGGGSGNITDINAQTGPSITITGVGPIETTTVGNVITISGTSVVGNSRWDPFIPPASGSPFDDEFESNFGSAPDSSKWTTFDPGSDITEMIIKKDPGRLSIKQGTGGEFGGVYFDRVDADGSFTAYTYVGITTRTSRGIASQFYAGIAFIENAAAPTTSNIILAGIHLDKVATTADGDVPVRVGMWEFNQYNDATETVRSSENELPDFSLGGGIFLRLRYLNTTNPIDFDWSTDGISWHEVATIDLDSAGVLNDNSFNAIGLFSRASLESDHSAEFSFFRLLENVTSLTTEDAQLPAGILGGNIEDPDFASLTAVTGTFTESLTISGVPVSTGPSLTGVMLTPGNQFLVDDAAPTVLDWNSEVYDIGGWHTNTSGPTISGHRITVPEGVSFASFQYQLQVTSSGTTASTAILATTLLKNGKALFPVAVASVGPVSLGNSNGTIVDAQSPALPVVVGDYFEVRVDINNYTVNAGTNGTKCFFSAKKEA